MMSSPGGAAETAPALSTPGKPCVACRRRKIRCDKLRPCSNCSKTQQLCTYENEELISSSFGPGDTAHADLQARLLRLENLIETMQLQDGSSGSAQEKPANVRLNAQSVTGSTGTQIFLPGSSLHLSCMFWASMAKEVEDMTCLLDEWGCLKAAEVPTGSSMAVGMMHPGHDAAAFLPGLEETENLLKHFFDSINPLIRVIQESYFRKELSQYRQGRFQLPGEFEALLFSILAVTTINLAEETVAKIFTEPKSAIVDRFNLATKTALSRVQFVRSTKILTFQALLLYITFLYTKGLYQDANGLLGLAARSAQTLGLQRDPSDYAYSPWISDMRRRFWNYLVILDAMAMVVYGCESCLPASTTEKPRNSFEEQWSATRFAKPSLMPALVTGFCNMSIPVIRGVLADLSREVASNMNANTTMENFRDNEARILRCKLLIEETYLKNVNRSNPQHAMATAIMENTLSLLRLSIRQHLVAYDQRARSQAETHSFCISAIKILETFIYHCTVFSKYHTDWLFKLYIPYLPLVITLSALARRALSPADTETAWRHVDSVLALYGQQEGNDTLTSPMWQLIHQMKEQAAVYVTAKEQANQFNESGTLVNNLNDASQFWSQMTSADPNCMEGEMMFDMFSDNFVGNAFLGQNAYDEGPMTSVRSNIKLHLPQ